MPACSVRLSITGGAPAPSGLSGSRGTEQTRDRLWQSPDTICRPERTEKIPIIGTNRVGNELNETYTILTSNRFPSALATRSRVDNLMSSAWFSILEIAVFWV